MANRESALPPKPKDFDSEEAKASGAVVVISLITGLCGTIAVFFAQSVKTNDFYLFGEYVLRTMRQPSYLVTMSVGMLLSGLALFGFSFALAIGGLLVKRRVMLPCLVGVVLSAGALIAGGGITLNFTSGLNSDINTGSNSQSGPARELQDFSIAMYTKCCLDANHVNGFTAAIVGKFGGLSADTVRWGDIEECRTFFTTNAGDETAQLTEVCVGNKIHVQWFESAVSDYVCQTLNSTVINIAGEELGNIELTGFTGGVEDIVIAGNADVPVYGCGGGKTKVFQFVNYLWFKTTVEPVGIALVVLGSVALLLGVLGLATTGITSGADGEINMLVLHAYMDQQEAALTAQERRQEARMSVERPATRPPPTASVVRTGDSRFDDVDDKI